MTIGLSMLRAVRSVPALGAGLVATLALVGMSGTGQTRATPPVLQTDTIARVARERALSVVFLHTMNGPVVRIARERRPADDLLEAVECV